MTLEFFSNLIGGLIDGSSGFYVGVDCGSQGTKAVVVDGEDGEVLGSGFVGYGLIEGLPPGHREQHPSTWVEAMSRSIRDALKEAKIKGKVLGIGVSGQQHGFVPLDAMGKSYAPRSSGMIRAQLRSAGGSSSTSAESAGS